MQVVVNSLLTNYQKTGQGTKTILLIHGWGDDLRTFKNLQSSLSKRFTVMSLDLPGFGNSQAPNEVWNLDNYARFVQQVLQKVAIKPYAIIAHSNGGALAIHGLSSGLLHADKLILLSSSGIRNTQKARRFALKLVAKTGKVVTFLLPNSNKQKLRKKLYGVAGSDMLVAPHLQETFKKTVRQDVQYDARKIKIPTMLIYGDQDKATPPVYGEIFHNLITGSTLEQIGGAGHFVHNDKPDIVLGIIEEFLDD